MFGSAVIIVLVLVVLFGVGGYVLGFSDDAAPIPQGKSLSETLFGSKDSFILDIPPPLVGDLPEVEKKPSFREALRASSSTPAVKQNSQTELLKTDEKNATKDSKKPKKKVVKTSTEGDKPKLSKTPSGSDSLSKTKAKSASLTEAKVKKADSIGEKNEATKPKPKPKVRKVNSGKEDGGGSTIGTKTPSGSPRAGDVKNVKTRDASDATTL